MAIITTAFAFTRRAVLTVAAGAAAGFASCIAAAQTDPLPSWNEGATKKSITDFVARVTTQGGAEFVPPAERIATFDNDGCLWAEQPIYFQFQFAFDRVKAMAAQHPEWQQQEPFRSFLAGDRKRWPRRAKRRF